MNKYIHDKLLSAIKMAVIKRDLKVHFPYDLAEIVFSYGDQLENALASIALSGREFWHMYCFSGEGIWAMTRIIQDKCDQFNAITRPSESEQPHWGPILPGDDDIYWKAKTEGKFAFFGQFTSLGYVLRCAADELLMFGKTRSKCRRERRKKLHAMRASG